MASEMPVAIVTGAGSGIGRAVALRLAVAGWAVALAGRTGSKLNETARLISAEHGVEYPVLVQAGDLAEPRTAHDLVRAVGGRFGRVDGVVNAAGYAALASIESTTPELWRMVVDANLSAAVHVTRAAWAMLKVRGGVVVNVSSQASLDPFEGLWAYGAAKAGLNLWTLATAREGAGHGIKAVAIAPGAVETPMLRGLFAEEQVPGEACLTAEEVADLIVACVTGRRGFEPGEVISIVR